MISDWRTCWDSRFCKQTIGLILIARFHYIVPCLVSGLSQEQHQVRLEVKIGFRGISGVKQSPRNTVLGPPSRSDVPLCSETKRSFKCLYLFGTAYG